MFDVAANRESALRRERLLTDHMCCTDRGLFHLTVLNILKNADKTDTSRRDASYCNIYGGL